MLKRIFKIFGGVAAFGGAILLVVFIINLQRPGNRSNQPGRSGQKPSQRACVSTPQPPTNSGINTPTPDLYGKGPLTTPPLSPSFTPLPISQRVDLAPELPERNKMFVYVMRCDGTLELYMAKPDADLSHTIPLQAGDVILHLAPPASMMGHQAPEMTLIPVATATSQVLPTNGLMNPYPSPTYP